MFLTTVREVGDQSRPLLEHYDVRQTWDWTEHGHTSGASKGTGPVRLRWLTRSDRPDYYTVERERSAAWGSYSRTWAFLLAHLWSEKPAFRCVGPVTLIRSAEDGSYLPLPIARAVVLESGVAAGSCTLSSGRLRQNGACADHKSVDLHQRAGSLRLRCGSGCGRCPRNMACCLEDDRLTVPCAICDPEGTATSTRWRRNAASDSGPSGCHFGCIHSRQSSGIGTRH